MMSRGQCPRGGACECPRVGVCFNFPGGRCRHADNVQGGGGACECPRVGVFFQFSGGRMTSRRQCPREGVLVECLTPLQEILYPRLPNQPLCPP